MPTGDQKVGFHEKLEFGGAEIGYMQYLSILIVGPPYGRGVLFYENII